MNAAITTQAPLEPDAAELASFHARWHQVGGSERANYQIFITELCALLGVPLPEPARDDTRDNGYVFERRVVFNHPDGTSSNGYIDCYRRGAFVLEAKKIRDGAALANVSVSGSKTRTFDDAMMRARTQAESYARALPAAEGRPPLLLVVDVGHVIETYAEFSRSGSTYTPFPDARSHRIRLDQLCDPGDTGARLRQRLRAAWLDPLSLDPSRASARVTREISRLLADLARSLEAAGHRPHSVAAFLSRCLFCMFAEDVGLLPKDEQGHGAFVGLLGRWVDQPATLARMLKALWMTMDSGGFSPALAHDLLRFNGKLFKGGAADDYVLPLDRDQIALLQRAARADWREVEPAIFGTLLERALSTTERHALGAHYTPRAYVERLVLPTVIEPLRADWADAQAAALLLAREADQLDDRKKRNAKLDEARAEIRKFHHQLCTTRVLDPACGSGNFLYVTLEHFKRLEAEVLDQLAAFGDTQGALGLEGETVTLKQFLGIELNPRAATLAELVLWIGWLQWQIRSFGNTSVAEPVVHDYGNIECRDAVLAWDAQEIACDADGKPLTRWDGTTRKLHPVTGELVPDEAAQVPQWRYINPRQAEWPQAEFIVGNPPFIGNKRMRDALGDGYTEALRGAWVDVPESADFVMYWWQKAALAVRMGKARRMGLITTNSLTMIFNRRVIEAALSGPIAAAALPSPSDAEPGHTSALMRRGTPKSGAGTPRPGLGDAHLAFAIPDHPWVDASDGAAVRISMTVVAANLSNGSLQLVISEDVIDDNEVDVVLIQSNGLIRSDLRIGADIQNSACLRSNYKLGYRGITLLGEGFWIDKLDPLVATEPGLLRQLRNGKDLTDRPRNMLCVDAFGLSLENLRTRFPATFQRLLTRVKPDRDVCERKSYRDKWWTFAEPRPDFREASIALDRYIVTPMTAKHRFFQFLDSDVLPDQGLIAVGLDDAAYLGTLSSVVHVDWAISTGGRLGVGNDPRYNNSRCFETFPFPADDTGLTPALTERIRSLAEQLDAHRKARQAAHEVVTLTGMYNVLEKLRRGEALTAKDKVMHEQAQVSVLGSLHDDLDAAVLQAYGWSDLGAVPWRDDTARAAWTETLLERLVALNARRAAEEAAGTIRWLRPEFQDPARRAAAASAAASTQATGSPAAPVVSAAPTGQTTAQSIHPAAPTPASAPAEAITVTVDAEADETDAPATVSTIAAITRTHWPSDLKAQLRSVAELLATSPVALSEAQIAERYTGRGPWKKRLPDLLATLEALARARCDGGLWRGA
ncbi:MAG: hypothetical protein RLY71_4188 [Pseudomonadota bacterium]|jgi:hypothetical protein